MARRAAPDCVGPPTDEAGASHRRSRHAHRGGLRGRGAAAFAASIAGGLLVAAIPASSVAAPPPGRAFELVSPPDHLSGAVPGMGTDLYAMPGLSSDDGDAVLFGAGSTMGPNWSGPTNPMIFGRRTDSGWKLQSAIRSVDEGTTPMEMGKHEAYSGWLTRSGREFLFGTASLGSTPPSNVSIVNGIYRTTDVLAAPEWLSKPVVGAAAPGVVPRGVSAADDTRVAVFESTAPLTADAPSLGTSAVYVQRGGKLELASRMPDNSVPAQNAYLANVNGGANIAATSPPALRFRNQLAGGGRYVLFLGGGLATSGSLYVRDLELGVTRQLAGGGGGAAANVVELRDGWGGAGGPSAISIDDVTVPSGTVFGAKDGARAFFHEAASVNQVPFMYEANLENGTVTARSALTGPPLGLSDDGSKMLFIEPPAGAPGGTFPVGNWTLRYWDADNPNTSVAVGTINRASASAPPYGLANVYRASKDGRTWIFTASGSPDPARPNVAPNTLQLYRWTLGDGTPTCLTCQPTDGVARSAGVNLTVQEGRASEGFLTPTTPGTDNLGKVRIAQRGHSVSDDGRWILFDSPDRLVDEDTNNVRDVYLWDRDADAGSRLQLLTSGAGTSPSFALDLDPTGRNAFFTTREGLVGADEDGSYDVYVARVGGGFPDSPESCTGEACRPPVILDPPHDLISSDVLREVPGAPKQSVQKGSPKLRIRSVRTSTQRLTVRVDTPKAGRIRVSGKQVRTTNRTAKRATTYTLRVPLSAAAKRQVARGKTVKVGLRVRFTPSGSKKASSVSTSVSVKKGR